MTPYVTALGVLRLGCMGKTLELGAFHGHGATPSHHPFIDGIFPEINHLFDGTLLYGNPHIYKRSANE